jgi:type III restriction enzyme
LLEFSRRAVAHLTGKRGLTVEELARFKYQLAKALERKVAECRQKAYERGYQAALFAPQAQVEATLDAALAFRFDSRPYLPAWPYAAGRYEFRKSYVLPVGELKATGEEFDCAQVIDTLPQVKHWIRNLGGPGRHETSFWLPTSSDRFYPDFVAELADGRILVVEYKGEAYATNDDSKEKRNIGELWQQKSSGRGLFLMAEKVDAEKRDVRAQIEAKIAGK